MTKLDEDLEKLWNDTQFIRKEEFYKVQERRNAREIGRRCDGKWSLARGINGLLENDLSRLAPYEFEVSERIAKEVGRPARPGHMFVPVNRRDLNASTASAGGYLISTEVGPGDLFVEYLHAADPFTRLGAATVNLRGNASVPRVTSKFSTGWMTGESATLTESQFTLAVSAGTPHNVGGYAEMSRALLLSTGEAAQAFVWRELARAVAFERATKFFTGSGAAGEPTGLLTLGGISSVSGASLGYSGVLDCIKNVENANGLVQSDRAAAVLAPDAARIARAREKAAGSGMIMTGNDLAGYPATVTKCVPDSTLVFGDWSQLAVLNWSTLEIGTDPYGASSTLFKSGLVGIRAIWSTDLVVLHSESFSKITGIS